MSSLGTKVFTLYMLGVPQTKIITFCVAPELVHREDLETQGEGLETTAILRGKKANLKTNVNKEIVCIRMD